MAPRLRLFTGETSGLSTEPATAGPAPGPVAEAAPVWSPALIPAAAPESPAAPLVSVRLGEILEPLLEACRSNRTFLRDFADDEIQLTPDLYDVLTTARRLRVSA